MQIKWSDMLLFNFMASGHNMYIIQ